jgi:hypothetical protein
LNVYNVRDVGQIHTAKPLVSGLSHPEVETAIAKLKKHNCQIVMKFWQN